MAHRPDPGRARGARARGARGVRREHSSAQRAERRHPVRRRNLYVRPVAADSQRPARTCRSASWTTRSSFDSYGKSFYVSWLSWLQVAFGPSLVCGPLAERRDVRGRGDDAVPARAARLRRRAGTRGARHAAVPAVAVLLVDLAAEGVDVLPADCARDCRNRVVPRARLVAAARRRGDSAGRQSCGCWPISGRERCRSRAAACCSASSSRWMLQTPRRRLVCRALAIGRRRDCDRTLAGGLGARAWTR